MKIQIISLLLCIVQTCLCISFVVPAGQESCFYEDITSQTPVQLMFEVSKGAQLDIDVTVRDPYLQVVYAIQRQQAGKHNFFTNTHGRYKFCFSNAMSTVSAKTVSVMIEKGNPPPPDNSVKTAQLSQMEELVQMVSNGIQELKNDQEYLKMREKTHRNTDESTNARVVWWSTFEVVLLFGMSAFQVFYLRKLFEVKRPV